MMFGAEEGGIVWGVDQMEGDASCKNETRLSAKKPL
jgi:hypothetical protein